MDGSAAPTIARRALYDAAPVSIVHVVARPSSPDCIEVEAPRDNVLALPMAGVFARHGAGERRWIATAGHALLFRAGQPYRVSFPGCVGDQVLSLQWSDAALEAALPEARTAFDAANDAHFLLEPGQMVRRMVLWRQLAQDAVDPLEVEALCAELLQSCVCIKRAQRVARRRLDSVKEAVALAPERKWTLAELAGLARMSPYHLAHVFRQEVGVPVYAYVVRARLARALSAVVDSDADITTIALDSGFASPSHFSARFRALFGMAPRDLRHSPRRAAAQVRKIVTAR